MDTCPKKLAPSSNMNNSSRIDEKKPMVAVVRWKISETLIYSRKLGHRSSARHRAGKERNHEQCTRQWREIIKVPVPKAGMAAAIHTRNSGARKCSAHSEPTVGRAQFHEEEEGERKKEAARWTPVPHVIK